MTPVLACAGALLLVVTVVAVVMMLRRRVVVVSVIGASMAPTLRHGDRVLVRRMPCEAVRRGDVVVFRELTACRPGDPTGLRDAALLVKRVAAVAGDPNPPFLPAWARRQSGVVPPGHLVLLGDNAEVSRDSRQFGSVAADRLLGVAVRRVGGEAL